MIIMRIRDNIMSLSTPFSNIPVMYISQSSNGIPSPQSVTRSRTLPMSDQSQVISHSSWTRPITAFRKMFNWVTIQFPIGTLNFNLFMCFVHIIDPHHHHHHHIHICIHVYDLVVDHSHEGHFSKTCRSSCRCSMPDVSVYIYIHHWLTLLLTIIVPDRTFVVYMFVLQHWHWI